MTAATTHKYRPPHMQEHIYFLMSLVVVFRLDKFFMYGFLEIPLLRRVSYFVNLRKNVKKMKERRIRICDRI